MSAFSLALILAGYVMDKVESLFPLMGNSARRVGSLLPAGHLFFIGD